MFGENEIHLIELESGEVRQTWDMTELFELNLDAAGYDDYNNVLNGIAYHPATDTFILTGKDWDLMFFVKLQINL